MGGAKGCAYVLERETRERERERERNYIVGLPPKDVHDKGGGTISCRGCCLHCYKFADQD